MDGGFPFTCLDIFPQFYFQAEACASLLFSSFFFPVGANLSASWLQSSKKVQTEKRRERDGVREDGEPCVEEGERWCGGGMQRKRQERRGEKRMKAEVMDSNEMK